MGFLPVIHIYTFVTVDTSDLTVYRFNEVLIDTIGVPAPHPRGGNASTGYGRGPSRGSGSVAVHFLEIGMTLDAFTAGQRFFLCKELAAGDKRAGDDQDSDRSKGQSYSPVYSHRSSLNIFYVTYIISPVRAIHNERVFPKRNEFQERISAQRHFSDSLKHCLIVGDVTQRLCDDGSGSGRMVLPSGDKK